MCGGSFMSNIGRQVGSALGGGANPLQGSGGGGGLMGGAIGGIAPQIGGFGFGGGMPAPMQNPFLGGQPQGMSLPPPIPPAPQGPGAGPTSQPQTMQDMLARARGLIGSQGGGMGQPHISDTGYFGPGTMSNPTGPQYGGGMGQPMTTQVSRPPVDVPPYAGIPPEMLSKFFPTQFDKPTVLPTGTEYKPQNFGDFGFDKQMVDYLNNQRKMSAMDAGVNYTYDPATQTFKGYTMSGPVTKTMDQMRQEAAGYKPGMGGGMGQPYISDRGYFGPGTMSNPTGPQFGQDRVVTSVNRPMPSVPPAPQGPGAGVTPEMLSKLLQGTPSGANGPYPAQVSTLPFQPQQISLQQQQQRMMDRLNQQFGRQMQPYQQQMDQLQQKYMSQPPQELLRFDQEFQKMPEYQAMQKAAQSGNIQEADRLRNAFESSPQFQQFQLTRNAYEQQQQQAQQKMMADPRFNQLQNRMQELQRRQQRLIQARQPQPQVFPAQPRPQVLPSEGLGAGLAGLLGGMMF